MKSKTIRMQQGGGGSRSFRQRIVMRGITAQLTLGFPRVALGCDVTACRLLGQGRVVFAFCDLSPDGPVIGLSGRTAHRFGRNVGLVKDQVTRK
jgi:hypothetical protein